MMDSEGSHTAAMHYHGETSAMMAGETTGMHDTTTMASDTNGFCSGDMGMVMYMEGFQWAFKGDSTCINLFVASWTLNTRTKFVVGMLGVILLGISTEGITRLRHDLSNKARGSHPDEHWKYTIMQTGLHGLHAFTGYMLMLATMTFAWELMLSVIVGLMIGYYNFGGNTTISSNPCCAFLEDESDSPGPSSLEPLLPRSEGNNAPVSQGESCCSGGNHENPRNETTATDIA